MGGKTVLISGASIAGPALAFWLSRFGYRPTVVERAPALRAGGQAVDFRGPVHLGVLRRMGLLDRVRERQTGMGEQTVLDETGRERLTLPASLISGEVEILRGDLSEILYEASRAGTEYLFGDLITSIDQHEGGVDVTFDRAAPRTFDLVVGADGLHSGVRALAFGPESQFVRFSGYYYGGATVPNHLGLDHRGLIYNAPGRGVMLTATSGPTARLGLVFASPELDYDRHDQDAHRKLLLEAYHGVGWEVPRLLAGLRTAPEVDFDSISRVLMEGYVRGRVALLGDAGYGATVGGLGSGLAVVAAYVLAGELARAGGDHRIAFPRYEQLIRPFALGCQKIGANAGAFLAPATRGAIRRRDLTYRVLTLGSLGSLFDRITTHAAGNITLPAYPS